MLTGKMLALPYQRRESFVVDGNIVQCAAFAGKVQHSLAIATEARMSVQQRGEPEAAIAACILRVADTDAGGVHEAQYQGEHLLLGQAGPGEILAQGAPQP